MLRDPLPARQRGQRCHPELGVVAVVLHPEPGSRVVTTAAEQLVQLGQPVGRQLDHPGTDVVQQSHLLELVVAGGQLPGMDRLAGSELPPRRRSLEAFHDD
jgi:hypothetical protein